MWKSGSDTVSVFLLYHYLYALVGVGLLLTVVFGAEQGRGLLWEVPGQPDHAPAGAD